MRKALLVTSLLAGCIAGAAIAHAADKPNKPDPDMQAVLDALASLNGKPVETLSPQEARKQPTPADAVKKVLVSKGQSAEPDDSVTLKTQKISGPNGDFPIHIYTPKGNGPFPVMVYYHGGGFVIADSKVYDATPRALAKGAQAIMVSVDYHQAPEHKFPAAPNDAYAAYQWVLKNAKDFNGDPKRVAVGGESAGGNLATVVSLMARDKKETLPVHQLLVYPVVDGDMTRPSYKKNADAKPLSKPMMAWFFKHYAGDPTNPYALPIKAKSLKGLPPTTVIAAEIDPLLSEGKDYADRLKKDDVKVTYKEYKGVTHEFFGMGLVVGKAKDAQEFAVNELNKAFK
jgi:acetyl esterase